ncbi:MAG: hypothetical protein Q4D38_09110 [Planctomycetia bacterium]|nr:hypothetical protein [Planctomycetia bacterium]
MGIKMLESVEELPPKIIAVIDIGTNSIRSAIAQAYDDGRVEALEELALAVWFGRDTFQRGGLSSQSMRAGIDILRKFQRKFVQYRVEKIRAVATAGIREAGNADIFIDRVRIATGLEIEIIDPAEEIQYSVLAVLDTVDDAFAAQGKNILIVDVGGGNTLLSIVRDGAVVFSQSLNIGAIRMREFLADPNDTPQNNAAIYRHNILEILNSAEAYFPFSGIDYYVMMGGDARFAAKQVGESSVFESLMEISLPRFDTFVKRCLKKEPQRLCREYGITFKEAETTVPALLTYQEIARKTGLQTILVSPATMRQGLLMDLTRSVWGLENGLLQRDVLDAAKSLAQKYHVDLELAECTSMLAARVFDEMKAEHGLGARYRLLLQVAALLQNAGRFVSNRSFHKHTLYLINNSEIFGLRRAETELVAYIARYSCQSAPKVSHAGFMSLSRESRVLISKLAAMLRIADALNHGKPPAAASIRFEREGDELSLYLPPDDTFLLKVRSLEKQGKMFEDVFGMKVSFFS